jgi:hypothetical protein
MHQDAHDSPFEAPDLMSGYPLDIRERAALQAALEAVRRLHHPSDVGAAPAPTTTPFEAPRGVGPWPYSWSYLTYFRDPNPPRDAPQRSRMSNG